MPSVCTVGGRTDRWGKLMLHEVRFEMTGTFYVEGEEGEDLECKLSEIDGDDLVNVSNDWDFDFIRPVSVDSVHSRYAHCIYLGKYKWVDRADYEGLLEWKLHEERRADPENRIDLQTEKLPLLEVA